MSVGPCLPITLKSIVLRRGNGGGTCLRLPVFCRKVPKLTPLDPVLEHLFVVSGLELGTSVGQKCVKNDAFGTSLSWVNPRSHRIIIWPGVEGHLALQVYSSIL